MGVLVYSASLQRLGDGSLQIESRADPVSVTAALHKALCWLQSQQSTASARVDPAWSSSKEQMWVPGLCSTSGSTGTATGSSELPCFPGWTSRHAAWSRMRRGMCGELTHRFPSGLWGAPGLVTSHSAAPCPHRWVRRAAGCSGVQWGAVGCSNTCLAGEPRPARQAGAAAGEGAVAAVLARHLAESCKRDQTQRHWQGWGSRAPSPATKGVCAHSSPGRSGSIRPGKCLVLSSELCWEQISC